MPRKVKFVATPSRLSEILAHLRKEPRPQMRELKSLKITYAYRNDHWGARHFVKDELPRIRYANPRMDIQVNKLPKTPQDNFKPEVTLELRDGSTRTLDVDGKWSSTIFTELMDIGGGPGWAKWKEDRAAAGLPVVDIPKPKPKPQPKQSKEESPFWSSAAIDMPNPFSMSADSGKTGAAAVLP
ncbi:hypothetical protein PsYK624_160300 [Phanerochaete sordida]|uniref:Ribosomal protein/NADH dehydrogenase domain-containing protein n=1 Tax=Phanerochaete sordida TaxID=48140 RepID=A0A9P3LMJ3_9APHY|nr:hypothetical protein PsYK624_160300 [Phanerochaete sordida]